MAWITNLADLKSMLGLDVTMIDTLPVDVLVSEVPTYDFEVTEHPVDADLPVTDARVARPVSVRLECIFTDPDFSPSAIGRAALSGTLSWESWTAKFEKLQALKDNKRVINILTPLNLYTSMMITRVEAEQTAQKATALFVTVEARQVRVVESATTQVDADKIPQKTEEKKAEVKQTNKAKSAKKIEPKKTTTTATPKDQSILSSLFS